jgi:hypothetical protein
MISNNAHVNKQKKKLKLRNVTKKINNKILLKLREKVIKELKNNLENKKKMLIIKKTM